VSGGDAPIIGRLFMVLLPLLVGGYGAWLLYDVLRIRGTGVRVPGVVGGHQVRIRVDVGDAQVGATSSAVFSFRTKDGRDVRTRQRIRVSTNLMRTGRRVTVAYDPADPERAEILEARSQVLGAALFTAVGGVLFVVALAVALF